MKVFVRRFCWSLSGSIWDIRGNFTFRFKSSVGDRFFYYSDSDFELFYFMLSKCNFRVLVDF